MDRDPTGCSHPSEAWSNQQRFQEVLDLRAKVAALTQQVEGMKESVHHWRRQYNIECENLTKLEAERDTLSAANAWLAKDAERYRWLRNNCAGDDGFGSCTLGFHWNCYFPLREDGPKSIDPKLALDNAVDAATAQAKQAEGGGNEHRYFDEQFA
jgi:hypothetical protein